VSNSAFRLYSPALIDAALPMSCSIHASNRRSAWTPVSMFDTVWTSPTSDDEKDVPLL